MIDTLAVSFTLRGTPATFDPTTGQSSSLPRWRTGSQRSEPRRLTSRKAVPGKTAISSSFNGKLRNELLNGEICYSLREAKVVIEQWRQHYKRGPTAFVARVSTAGAGNHHAACQPNRGASAAVKLTLRLDPSLGAGRADRRT